MKCLHPRYLLWETFKFYTSRLVIRRLLNKFATADNIDIDTVNKLVNIIPIMQNMGSTEVAKAIVKEFHDNKPKSNGNKPKAKTSGSRKPKNTTKNNIDTNIEVVK